MNTKLENSQFDSFSGSEVKINEFKCKMEKGNKQIPYIENEQQTKNALIEPMLRALDYDIEDIEIIKGEYTIEGNKRIDYQIMMNKKPMICIEAKKATINLTDKHIEQLACYVYQTNSKIGVLTNGITWMIFGAEEDGIMNKNPVRVIKDITRLTDEEVKEIIEKYNYNEVNQNIKYITEIIQLKQKIIKLEQKEKANIQSTTENKKFYKCIEYINACEETKEKKAMILSKTEDEIKTRLQNIDIKQRQTYDAIEIKETNIKLGTLSPLYRGIRLYINVEEIYDPKDLTEKAHAPKGVRKNGYGQYFYTIMNEEDIEYVIFLLEQAYQENVVAQ